MCGIDHKKADLDERSRFSFTSKRTEAAYEAFMQEPLIGGCVLISTCNRTEFWIHTRGHDYISPTELLCGYLGVPGKSCRDVFLERRCSEAIDHLFRLTAGLESKIIGEGQILTQVGDAIAFARSCYASDNTLEVLFRKAVTAGKRVRTETDLSTADRSVIHTALEKLAEEGFSPEGRNCLVIGNGMMGRLSAGVLLEKGALVTMTVRKYHKGIVEIPHGCSTIDYEDRYSIIPGQDLIVSATASPNFTLTADCLSELSAAHELMIIDLAVPRDVEPAAKEIAGIRLYDIDSFQIDMQSDRFKMNLDKAERIIEEVKADFYAWREARDMMPVLTKLKKKAGEDVTLRMSPYLKHIPLDPEEKDVLKNEISGASERTVNHLLFTLKSHMSDGAFREMIDAMETIADHKANKKEGK